ncbi:MAG: sulfatase family protein [Woeseiaceae bacterium]
MLSRQALLLLFLSLSAIADDRPNIVLIATDNQSEKVLGAYGNEDIKTPHIDSLAEQGMLFRQAFSASGVCSPTRATLMTGLMPSQHGVHNAMPSQFEIEDWAAVEEYRNLPQTLAESGYATGLVGKYHLGDASQAQMGFDYWVTFPTGHTTKFHGNDIIDNGKTYTLDEEQHLTDFWTDKALQFIDEQNDDEPFFLYVSYNGPYNLPPLVIEYPKNRHAAYYEENVPAFPQEPVNPSLRRLAIRFSNVDVLLAEQNEWWVTDEERVDETTAKAENAWPWQTIAALNNPTAMIHLASETTMIDDGVGRILDSLREHGMDDNTIVIFTSDQPSAFGHHGLWGNSSYADPHPAYMENMRVPLIVRFPGVVVKNAESQHVINQYDLFPTLLDLVDMQQLEIANTPGKSFEPILRGEDQAWENFAFWEYITVRAVTTPEWKYVKRLFGAPSELYNLVEDPDEMVNVAGDDDYAEILVSLDAVLESFFADYSVEKYDPWRGGSAKALMMYSDENEAFEARYPDWQAPTIEKLEPFSDRF